MIRVGIIGLGYWGPNLVRTFDNINGVQVAAICDVDLKRLGQVTSRFRHIRGTDDATEILLDKTIDAVVIVTPTRTHYTLARQALECGKHVFVEKPLATSAEECETLIDLAQKKGTVLFVGHVFLYNAAVIKLKEMIDSKALGRVCYISSDRLNLGPVRKDVNALWDLATHDISIILHLMESAPVSVNAHGLAHLNKRIHDVCTLNIDFANSSMATIRVSWLDPNKIRRMTVVGDQKMAVYDDIDPLEKIKIYDKGIDKEQYTDTFGDFQINYRYGDTHSPRIVEAEPLKAECEHFIECIVRDLKPKTDGQNGLEVVRVLTAADLSLRHGGSKVHVDSHEMNFDYGRRELVFQVS
jgi:predicted dehydrogenase